MRTRVYASETSSPPAAAAAVRPVTNRLGKPAESRAPLSWFDVTPPPLPPDPAVDEPDPLAAPLFDDDVVVALPIVRGVYETPFSWAAYSARVQ